MRQALGGALAKSQRITDQSRSRKNTSGSSKLYAWHAPEVECIAKGKSKTPYEFGVKAGIAATLNQNLIVSARAFTDNPYDGQAADCCAFNTAGWTCIDAFLSNHVRKTVAARSSAEVAGIDTVLCVLVQVMTHGETP